MNISRTPLRSRMHALSCAALLVLCSALQGQTATDYPHPPPIKQSADGTLTSFLMLGPMPTAGLTINNALGERHCAPSVGEIYRAEQWQGWWREAPAASGMLDVNAFVSDYLPHAWPPHYPDVFYLHTYLTVTNTTRARLVIDGHISDAHVWLKGAPQARHGKNVDVSLTPGTHGLLVKCFGFQTTGMPWNVNCQLTDPQGRPQPDVVATLNHPQDAPAELYFRNNATLRPGEAPSDRIEVRLHHEHPTPAVRTYYEDRDVAFIMSLKYLNDIKMLRAYGPANYTTWTGFRGSVTLDVFDFWGQHTTNITTDITIRYQLPCEFRVNLSTLARGHYTIRLGLHDEAGRRLMQRSTLARSDTFDGSVPMQFAVISHATNMTVSARSALATSTDHTSRAPASWKRMLTQSRLLGSRLHMPEGLAFWPQDTVFSNAVHGAPPIQVWPTRTETALRASRSVDLPLCGNLDIWTPSGQTQPVLKGAVDTNAVLTSRLPSRITAIVDHYKAHVRHWRFHHELNTLSADSPFMQGYAAALHAGTAAVAATDPTAQIIAPGLTGADTNALLRYELADAIGTNGWINLHTYSWGYATAPDLVSGAVQASLADAGSPRDIVISRSGHDRAYPGNGVLGQTQQLAKWFAYALARPDIRKVFFSMQPGERYTPVDARQGPYPAWVALRTMGLLLDGADSVIRRETSALSHAFAAVKGDTHLLLLWHDADAPASVRVDQDVTYVNMMDQRFPAEAGTPITVDQLPVILLGKAPLTLLAPAPQ